VAVTSYRGELQISVNASASALAPFGHNSSNNDNSTTGTKHGTHNNGSGAEELLMRIEGKLNALAASSSTSWNSAIEK
jgi:hypothetical protein